MSIHYSKADSCRTADSRRGTVHPRDKLRTAESQDRSRPVARILLNIMVYVLVLKFRVITVTFVCEQVIVDGGALLHHHVGEGLRAVPVLVGEHVRDVLEVSRVEVVDGAQAVLQHLESALTSSN